MAAKVQLLSIDRRSAEHIKRSRAESLVRRLLAIQIAKYVYQRVRVRPADEIASDPSRLIPEHMPPAEVAGIHFADPVKKPIQPRMMFLSRSERAQQYEVPQG